MATCLVNFVFSNSTTTIAPVDTRFLCKGHKDGEFLPDPTNPHVFYECSKMKALKFQCPKSTDGQLIFDKVKKVCVFPNL